MKPEERDDFFTKRLRGGTLLLTTVAATIAAAVGDLERVVRGAHLGAQRPALPDGDRQALQEVCRRFELV